MRKLICTFIILGGVFISKPLNVQADALPTAGVSDLMSEIDNTEPIDRDVYEIQNHSGMKTYMGYRTITSTTSKQYELQQYATTNDEGFRMIDNRYLVAIGTAFNASVGQKFDATLDNGECIHCIVGDIKQNKDTDVTNTFTQQGCCLEFIVDTNVLNNYVKKMGDCSYLCKNWDSPCVEYTVYDLYK